MYTNWQLLWSRVVIASLLLGFASGLPLALTTSTLQAWFTDSGASLVLIGSLSLIGQPYIYKFLWAPILDRFIPPLLGRRRGWIILTQLALVLTIAGMSYFDPTHHGHVLYYLALIVAFLSASQDIAINGWMTDSSNEQLRGLIGAAYIAGYRVAIIISGALAMVLAGSIGWHQTYMIMAMLMIIGIITAWFAPEPAYQLKALSGSLGSRIVTPFLAFFHRFGPRMAAILLFVMILYKMGDAFALSLNTTFLLRALHFSLADVGLVNKMVGMAASIVGGIVGGLLMTRISLLKALVYFGLLQAVSNLAFMGLAIIGHDFYAMAATIFIEQFFGGLGNAAFLGLIMALCDKQFSAGQFALLTALTSIGRVYMGPVAAMMIDHMGWTWFYFWSFIIGLPGVLLLLPLKHVISRIDERSV